MDSLLLCLGQSFSNLTNALMSCSLKWEEVTGLLTSVEQCSLGGAMVNVLGYCVCSHRFVFRPMGMP